MANSFWFTFSLIIVEVLLACFPNRSCFHFHPSELEGVPESKIINGEKAARGQFPYQAAMKLDKKFFCGGSLISNLWILTAAHCAYKVEEAEIYLGAVELEVEEEGRLTINCRVMVVHEEYNEYLNNDVALIKLPNEVTFSEYIKPLALPRKSDTKKTFVNETVQVCGWGRVSDESETINKELHYINLTIISNEECVKSYQAEVIIESTICASADQAKTTCRGDSGGGLVLKTSNNYTHIGVVSFVSKKGCSSGAPSGYVRTTSYLDWISNVTDIEILD